MDAYIYNKDFQQIDIVDTQSSLIWTERYNEPGEIQLIAADNLNHRTVLKEDNFVQIGSSVEATLLDQFFVEKKQITVKGKTLDDFLRHRFAKRSWTNSQSYIELSGNPVSIIHQLIRNFAQLTTGFMGSGLVTNGTEGPYELFPNLIIAEPILDTPELLDISFRVQVPQGDLLAAIKYVADPLGLGFRMYPDNITEYDYDLVFQVIQGKDRTRNQDRNPVVTFQSSLDRLMDTKEFRSKQKYKNVAWAYATNIPNTEPLMGVAYASASAKYATGFERRTLFVDVSDLQADDYDLTTSDGKDKFKALLRQAAKNALINNNYVQTVDGIIVPQPDCQYGVHYGIGDIIELEAEDGTLSSARVSEYTYSEDESGIKNFPTLTALGGDDDAV